MARDNVKAMEKEAKTAKRAAEKAQKDVAKKKKMLEKKQEHVQQMLLAPNDSKVKKPTARNDLRLVNSDPSPRKVAELDGDDWKPPIYTEQTFADPGNSWKEQSIQKVKLLFALRRHLEEQKLVESFPTFIAMMQCLGIEDSIKFPHRAFIYLVALTLYESL